MSPMPRLVKECFIKDLLIIKPFKSRYLESSANDLSINCPMNRENPDLRVEFEKLDANGGGVNSGIDSMEAQKMCFKRMKTELDTSRSKLWSHR